MTDAPAIAAPTMEVAQQAVAPRRSRRFDVLSFGLGLWAIVVYVFLFLPIALIPLFSFNDSVQAAFPLKGFTLAWYESLIGNDTLHRALQTSLVIGVAAAALATAPSRETVTGTWYTTEG